MAKQELSGIIDRTIQEYCKRKGLNLPEAFQYDLVVSRDPAHGDFACNAAFKLAQIARARPNQIADDLVLLLESEGSKHEKESTVERMEVAGAGFINFYLKKSSLGQILMEVCRKNRDYGKSDFGKGRKVLLEYVSANPTGPLTIAHGRQAAVGDALARILRATGHHVASEYYLNDAGRQMNLLGKSLWSRYKTELKQATPLPEDGYQGEYLIDIAKKLVQEKQDSLLKRPEEESLAFCTQYAGAEIMAGIRKDLAEFRVKFDEYFSEQTLYQKNAVEKTLDALKKKNFIYEKDGALWFKSTDLGDDKDRVVRKSTGEYTYLAPDIAYHRQKFERGYEWLINFWGPDHHGYIPRLKAACQALGHDPRQVEIRIAQLSTLYRNGQPVRMSTRAGEFVTLRELMDEVGVDAARYFFIMRRLESHLDFDLDLAKQKSQDNPVYYLQYAYARIASVLRFAEREVTVKVNVDLYEAEDERNLIKIISDFPKALIGASESLEPYRLADYLRTLAMAFHKFYSAHRVVTENEELTQARLLLCETSRIVLWNGLELLGISQPESM
ncbi:MAG TPA: arginine--tRNA ligase [Verrucomicrobiae bacterium]|jgi:arginyl-tRNA synthetase|nr:arginine--tRNA ligase [Verrucomicrobiae bacterium]